MEGIERMDQGMQPDNKANTPFQSHVGNSAGNAVTPPHLGGHLNKTHIDEGALDYLIKKFEIQSMLDIGCGPGGMIGVARAKGLDAWGIDGDPSCAGVHTFIHDSTGS